MVNGMYCFPNLLRILHLTVNIDFIIVSQLRYFVAGITLNKFILAVKSSVESS